MEQVETRKNTFTAYDYKEVEATADQFSFLVDGYESFGWKLDENMAATGSDVIYADRLAKGKNVTIRMKRARKIMNKAELTRLQRNFEACVNEVKELERSKTSAPSVWALSIGVIGTGFMAGSVFAVVATPPRILLCILLAVPGFLGWILPYFVYKKMCAAKTRKIIPLIEAKYDEMYDLCEKGNKLLY